MPWLLPIVAYLVGSIPFGVLIARSKGIDIRKHGSGNVGATNVFRIVGKGFGISCLLLDFLKGFIPVVVATNLLQVAGAEPAVSIPFLSNLTELFPADQQLYVHTLQVVTALAAIMGHNYSLFLRGGGGKGIATSAGVLVALLPTVFLGALLVFGAAFYFTRYVSLGSIIGAISIPVFAHLNDRFRHLDGDQSLPTYWESGSWNKPLMAFTVVAALLAIWRHRSNIQRILAGTEDRLESRKNIKNLAPAKPSEDPDEHS